jgi:beta-lactamase regulating signal transducer with metallopeptidase domain
MALWQRILYFHVQPAIIDGMLSLLGILLILKLFRVRNPSVRAFFLFIPLVRPLLILLEGSSQVKPVSFPNVTLALRIPDPLNLLPFSDAFIENDFSAISAVIGALFLAAVVAACVFLTFRWAGFIAFYRRIRRRSAAVSADPGEARRLSDLVATLSEGMGLRRPPEIIFSDGNWMTPCAIGWRHPSLVLDPVVTQDLDDDELQALLAHELSHIHRRDGLWHWVSVLLRDIQSFSPFSHMSISRLGLEREKACDHEAVKAFGLPPRLMARCLVKTSKLMLARHSQPLPGYGMGFLRARQTPIEDRLNYLLDIEDRERSGRRSWNPTISAPRKLALLAVWLPMVTIQLYGCVSFGDYILMIK